MDLIPSEILTLILINLSAKELFKSQIICKRFKKLVYTSFTWSLYFQLRQINEWDVDQKLVQKDPKASFIYAKRLIIFNTIRDFINFEQAKKDGWSSVPILCIEEYDYEDNVFIFSRYICDSCYGDCCYKIANISTRGNVQIWYKSLERCEMGIKDDIGYEEFVRSGYNDWECLDLHFIIPYRSYFRYMKEKHPKSLCQNYPPRCMDPNFEKRSCGLHDKTKLSDMAENLKFSSHVNSDITWSKLLENTDQLLEFFFPSLINASFGQEYGKETWKRIFNQCEAEFENY